MSCNSNSDCESGRCAGRVGKECLPARSRSVDSVDREARGMKCWDGSGCHNYPMGAYFTCQNNGGTVSGRSVDSEEEKPARKLGLYQSCNSNSDCQSGRCAGRVGKECLPARSRSVDFEEEKPARKLGLYQSCNSNSDCQSGR